MLPVGLLYFLAFITIAITQWIVYKWKYPKCKNGILPPGSMGWPLIGESLELFVPGRSLDLHPFINKRIQRYGPIFRTSIAGEPVVISADREANHYLFLQEGKSVEFWYMDSFSKLFGLEGSIDSFTATHKYVRTSTMKYIGLESLKENLLPNLEKHVCETLSNWSKEDCVNVKNAAAKMGLNFIARRLISYDESESKQHLSENFASFSQGLMSFPVKIPGTAFHDCLKKRDLVVNVIRKKLNEKLNFPEAFKGDMLDQFVEEMTTKTFLTENLATQIILGLLFVGFESIAVSVTLALILLSEQPLVVDELRAEHEKILKKRKPGVPLTWEEYKSMTFTRQVINEVLRLANNFPGVLRRATKDIQVNGYTIPKGWSILVVYSAQHLSPNIFKNPLAFNPHRWKELESSVNSKDFMPFGLGTRQCAGAEYAKAFMSVFFHVLCTKYRWAKVRGGANITRKPFLDFGDGIHIKVSSRA